MKITVHYLSTHKTKLKKENSLMTLSLLNFGVPRILILQYSKSTKMITLKLLINKFKLTSSIMILIYKEKIIDKL